MTFFGTVKVLRSKRSKLAERVSGQVFMPSPTRATPPPCSGTRLVLIAGGRSGDPGIVQPVRRHLYCHQSHHRTEGYWLSLGNREHVKEPMMKAERRSAPQVLKP